MTRLILIRHGESVSTVARTIGGPRTCGGLSPLGVIQSERLRDRLAAEGTTANVLIASQYPRAVQTAEIIAPAMSIETIESWPGFGEHDPGAECDGMRYQEFVDKFGSFDWEADPYVAGFPGGETVAGFQLRVGEAVSEVLRTHDGRTVAIACHGGVIDAILRRALQAPCVGGFEIHTLNTSITELQLLRPGRWKLLRYNDAAHLVGLPRETPRE